MPVHGKCGPAGAWGRGPVKFLKAIFWEFVQNLPLIAGFIVALALWQQSKWGAAVACMVAGSVIGSLVIRLTESKIVESHREPLRVTIANIAVMAVLTFVLVAYLSVHWSSWKTDLLFGAVAGLGVAVAQDLAAGEPIGIRHCVALGFSGLVVLIGIRVLAATLPILASILIVTTVATLIIGLIDYGPTRIQRAR
jgi:hypothetical protein